MWTSSPARKRVRSKTVWAKTLSRSAEVPVGTLKRQGSIPWFQLEWVKVRSGPALAKTKSPPRRPARAGVYSSTSCLSGAAGETVLRRQGDRYFGQSDFIGFPLPEALARAVPEGDRGLLHRFSFIQGGHPDQGRGLTPFEMGRQVGHQSGGRHIHGRRLGQQTGSQNFTLQFHHIKTGRFQGNPEHFKFFWASGFREGQFLSFFPALQERRFSFRRSQNVQPFNDLFFFIPPDLYELPFDVSGQRSEWPPSRFRSTRRSRSDFKR